MGDWVYAEAPGRCIFALRCYSLLLKYTLNVRSIKLIHTINKQNERARCKFGVFSEVTAEISWLSSFDEPDSICSICFVVVFFFFEA